jgi:hypothetical protein
MTNEEKLALGKEILKYARKFNVPINFLFEILEDQKVTPMIRGKAMEYNAFLLLDGLLPKASWSVQKLNLNAQTGTHDEDISVTHRRTGIILKVESKSAVRGSATTGKRTRHKIQGFNVKSHRSRSNIKLAGTSNDRYSIDSFDVLVTNTSNAVYQGNTVGEGLEIIHDKDVKAMLYDFYHVSNDEDLRHACENDWRFVIPSDIGIDGFIPRTPFVRFTDDPHWRPLGEIEEKLLDVVKARRDAQTASRR